MTGKNIQILYKIIINILVNLSKVVYNIKYKAHLLGGIIIEADS